MKMTSDNNDQNTSMESVVFSLQEVSMNDSIDLDILGQFEGLMQAKEEADISEKLIRFTRLLECGVSGVFLSQMMREFNLFLNRTALRYPDSKKLFCLSLGAVIDLKKQMDLHPQGGGGLSPLDWVEVEKALFCLSEWEGHFSQESVFF